MKNWILIGHRGAGKSHFLENLSKANHVFNIVSLDQKIVEKYKKSIESIFLNEGEEFFRQLEIQTFNEIVAKVGAKPTIIDVGAGFQGEVPIAWHALWIQRPTNPLKFLFLNRPKLNNSIRMDEKLFAKRQNHYNKISSLSIELLEGQFHQGTFELSLMHSLIFDKEFDFIIPNNSIVSSPSCVQSNQTLLTLLNDDHALFHLNHKFLHNCLFELRDDLLSDDIISKVLKEFPKSLLSLRDPNKKNKMDLSKVECWDWPLEWGDNKDANILSLHSREETLSATLKKLPETEQIIKLAVEIKNFNELKEANQWQQQKPDQRVFLPRSKNGRWSWFRLLTHNKMPFSFLREAEGSSLDQPTLAQFYCYNSNFNKFAAILGSPVQHSLTPSFHSDFFNNKKANVLKIEVFENEWQEAMSFLTELGLNWAAITSPLKKVAYQWLNDQNGLMPDQIHKIKNLNSINTIKLVSNNWVGINTDSYGFQELMNNYKTKKVAVWGGEGTLSIMSEVIPNAVFYSSRTGKFKSQLKEYDDYLNRNTEISFDYEKGPEVLVWGVGNALFRKEGQFPPSHWTPEIVIDLNYTSDSPGIECADKFGCQYQSGMVMFTTQAKKQQEFWQ
jgi:shikimate 5-dehydrogenase/shikimate kinase